MSTPRKIFGKRKSNKIFHCFHLLRRLILADEDSHCLIHSLKLSRTGNIPAFGLQMGGEQITSQLPYLHFSVDCRAVSSDRYGSDAAFHVVSRSADAMDRIFEQYNGRKSSEILGDIDPPTIALGTLECYGYIRLMYFKIIGDFYQSSGTSFTARRANTCEKPFWSSIDLQLRNYSGEIIISHFMGSFSLVLVHCPALLTSIIVVNFLIS
jgi:hypothetical protein